MTTWAFRTMIVPSDYQSLAAALAQALGGLAGENMFVVGLSASGEEPASSYVSTGYIGEEFANLLPLDTYTTEIDPNTGDPVVIHTHKDGDPVVVAELANEAGLTVSVQEVIDLFNVVDVTEQEPFTAFARLGLQIAQPPLPAP